MKIKNSKILSALLALLLFLCIPLAACSQSAPDHLKPGNGIPIGNPENENGASDNENDGNTITGTCTVYVYKTASALSSYDAVQTGNSNYAKREVSLYAGGQEKTFADGIYTKANGTLSLAFDIAEGGFKRFTANVGVDKVIRDNKPYGAYVNATVRVYADDQLLFEKTGLRWTQDYTVIAVTIPDGTKTLKLEITDTTGQGGIGWGNCLLYK